MGFLSRVLSAFSAKHADEGAYREGPYYLPYSGGWLSADAGRHINWWQTGHSLSEGPRSAMVEACVSAYAQTIAMCPGNHWAWTEDKGRNRVYNSALTRVLRRPNPYQTISDFLLNAVRALQLEGNAYALALRNERFEIVELHLMDPSLSAGQVAENGEVFYHLSGNPVIERLIGKKLIVPARDVLHLRLHTPRHPLVGETPLAAAALQMAAGNAALQQQVLFYLNQARPSFILTTDQVLRMEQVKELRELWNQQAAGMAKGGTPILTAGLKAQPISISSVDAQLADLLKLSDQAIANVFRVPLQALGVGDTPYASTEALMQHWLASGLGFVLNHIEEAIGILFKLKGQPDEYLEFDTTALQRSAFKDRVEAWTKGITGGLFASNEGRRDFEFKPVADGDEPRVQQQQVPLSWSPPEPAPPPAPKPDEDDPEEADKALAEAVTRHLEAARAA